jgi:hypothetical protein
VVWASWLNINRQNKKGKNEGSKLNRFGKSVGNERKVNNRKALFEE